MIFGRYSTTTLRSSSDDMCILMSFTLRASVTLSIAFLRLRWGSASLFEVDVNVVWVDVADVRQQTLMIFPVQGQVCLELAPELVLTSCDLANGQVLSWHDHCRYQFHRNAYY